MSSTPTPRSRATTRKSVSIGLLTLAAGFSLLTATSADTGLSSRLWIAAMGSAVVGAGCLVLLTPAVRQQDGPFLARLGPATVVLYTLTFGCLGLAWLSAQSGSKQVIDAEQIPPAILVAMVGLAALTFGYVCGPPAGLVRAARAAVTNRFPSGGRSLRVPSIAVWLYLTGTLARGLRLSTGQYGYLQDASQTLASPSPFAQALSMMEALTGIGLVVAALDCFSFSRSLRSRIILACLAVVEIAVGLASASKEDVLFTLVTLALVWTFAGRKLPVLPTLAAALIVLLLFPFTTEYRSTARSGDSGQISASTALAQLPDAAGDTLDSATPESVAVDGPSVVARRLRQIDNVALVRQKTPDEIPYRPVTSLVQGPLVALVPRALWPSKPIISTGRDFSQDYYELPSSLYSANAITVPGDLIRHGGLPPLMIGLAILGIVLRLFDRALSPARDPRHLVVYVPLFLHLIKLESDVTVFTIGLIQLVILTALVSGLIFARPSAIRDRPNRPSSRAAFTHRRRASTTAT